MVAEVVEQLAVLHEELLEPGAVRGAERLQRLLTGDRLDLTHSSSVPREPPLVPAIPFTCQKQWHADGFHGHQRSNGDSPRAPEDQR